MGQTVPGICGDVQHSIRITEGTYLLV